MMGSCEAMLRKTVENLKKLVYFLLKNQNMIMVSIITLRSSIEIVNAFIDYDRKNILYFVPLSISCIRTMALIGKSPNRECMP